MLKRRIIGLVMAIGRATADNPNNELSRYETEGIRVL